MLRPGNVTAPAGAVGILRRLLMMVHHFFPGAGIRIRLDCGFEHPALLDFLDAEPKLEYVLAMAKNAALQLKSEEAMQYTHVLAGVTGKTEHVYSDANYAAGSWERERRILIKAKVVFRRRQRAQRQPALRHHQHEAEPAVIYEKVYCQRGEIENWIIDIEGVEVEFLGGRPPWLAKVRHIVG